METLATQANNVEIFEKLYYEVSEFMNNFKPEFQQILLGKPRQRSFCRLSIEEIMTILIGYQLMGSRNFKSYYKEVVLQFHRREFPNIISYERFISVSRVALIPLCWFLKKRLQQSEPTQLYVVDSTVLRVCKNARIQRHRTFKDEAARGKTGSGWFYGFKLHLIINHLGELMAIYLSPGNLDDRKGLKKMVHTLTGKLFGDKGYLSAQLFEELFSKGLELITTIRKNMKKPARSIVDSILLRKRAVIETTNDLLKNSLNIEHSRHRSLDGFLNNTFGALIAYSFLPKKPHMRGVDLITNQIIPLH